MNKQEEKKLHEAMIALFLLMLKYSNKINPILYLFKNDRDLVKSKINNIYSTYTKDGQLKMTSTQINKEIRGLEPVFKQSGKDLVLKEKNIITSLLPVVFAESYYRTYFELSKGLDLDVKKLTDSIINQSINQKIQGKSAFERNKDNKTKFISKVNRDIKEQLKKGSSIEVINKTIDKNFSTGAFYTQRLIENQITINFHNAQMEAYRNSNVERVLFSAVLDDRTSPLCESLDNEIFTLEDAPQPPLHLYCRSTLLPLFPNWCKTENSETYETFKKRNDID